MTIHESPPDSRPGLDGELRTYVRQMSRSLARLDRQLADDLEQDTYVSALQGSPEDPSSMRAWLRAVIRHRYLNLRNRQSSIPKLELLTDEHLTDTRNDPYRLLKKKEIEQDVRRLLVSLPAIYSDTLRMRFFDGARPAEIADELGVSQGTVRTRLRRALQRVRMGAGIPTLQTEGAAQTPPAGDPSGRRKPVSPPVKSPRRAGRRPAGSSRSGQAPGSP